MQQRENYIYSKTPKLIGHGIVEKEPWLTEELHIRAETVWNHIRTEKYSITLLTYWLLFGAS